MRDQNYPGILRMLDGFDYELFRNQPTAIHWARALRETGHASKALEILHATFLLENKIADVVRLAIDIHEDLENYERVLYFTDELLGMEPATPSTLSRLLRTYRHLGMWERAFEATQFILQSKIHSLEQSEELTRLAISGGRIDEIRLIRQRMEQTHGPRHGLVQDLRRAESCRNPSDLRRILLRQTGILALGSLEDDGASSPWGGTFLGTSSPDGSLNYSITSAQALETIKRFFVLLELSGARVTGYYAQEPRIREWVQKTLPSLGFRVLEYPAPGCVRLHLDPLTIESQTPGQIHLSLACPTRTDLNLPGTISGILLPENAWIQEFILKQPEPSTFSPQGLENLLHLMRFSPIPARIQRMNPPSFSKEEAKEQIQLELEGNPRSFGGLCWPLLSEEPPDFKPQKHDLRGLASHHPNLLEAKLTTLLQQNTEIKKEIRHFAAFLPKILKNPSSDLLEALQNALEKKYLNMGHLLELGAARILLHLDSKKALVSIRQTLKKGPSKKILAILNAWPSHHPVPKKLALWALQETQPESLPVLFDWLATSHARLSQKELELALSSADPQTSARLMLCSEKGKFEELPENFLNALEPSIRARIVARYQLKSQLMKEWEAFCNQTPWKDTIFPHLKGFSLRSLVQKMDRYLNQTDEDGQKAILKTQLRLGSFSSLSQILASPGLKKALRETLIDTMEDWIIRMDGESDILFLMATGDMGRRIHLGQSLLMAGNFEGWFMLERLFLTHAGLYGQEILQAMFRFRADKALEVFLQMGVKDRFLTPAQMGEFAWWISRDPHRIDEWLAHAGLPRFADGAGALETILEENALTHPELFETLAVLFPRQPLPDTASRLIQGQDFKEEIYDGLNRAVPAIAQRWLAESTLRSGLAQILESERRLVIPWLKN